MLILSRITVVAVIALFVSSGSGADLIHDDFQASLGATPNSYIYSEIGVDARGNYLVAWMENTGTYDNKRIVGRHFNSSGVAISARFEITTDVTLAYRERFTLSMSDSGNFIVAWKYKSGSIYRCYVRRYNKDRTPFDAAPVNINTNTALPVNNPDVALNNSGDCAVAWEGTGGTIVGGLISANVSPVLTPFTLDSLGIQPHIALSDTNTLVVSFIYSYSNKLMYQVFSYKGGITALWHAFPVSTTGIVPVERFDLDIMKRSGQFIIVWPEWTGTAMEIKGAKYSRTGAGRDAVFYVEENLRPDADRMPSVHINRNNNFIVTWASPFSSKLSMRAYAPDGRPLIDAQDILPNLAKGPISDFSSVLTNNSRVIIICPQNGVNLQNLSMFGTSPRPMVKVDMLGSGAQYARPAVSAKTKSLAVVWEDGTTGRVMLQVFDSTNNALTMANPVNTDGSASNPVVAIDTNIFVAWEDVRSGSTDTAIFFQRFNSRGQAVGPNTRISELGVNGRHPAIAIGKGRVLFVWEDKRAARGDRFQVFGQFFTDAGQNIGGNFLVDTVNIDCYRPDVATSGKDIFAVVWYTLTGTIFSQSSNVYLKCLNRDGAPLGPARKLNGNQSKAANPRVAMDSASRTVAAWLDGREALFTSHVYGQRCNADGTLLDSNFRVDSDSTSKSYADVAMSANGGMAFSWQYGSNTRPPLKVVMREYDFNLTPHAPEEQQNYDSIRLMVAVPCMHAAADRCVLVWMNSSTDDLEGMDIWAQVTRLTDNTPSSLPPSMPRGLSNREPFIKTNPFSLSSWTNNSDEQVEILDVNGRTMKRVGPGDTFRFTCYGIYFFRSGKTGVVKAVRVK